MFDANFFSASVGTVESRSTIRGRNAEVAKASHRGLYTLPGKHVKAPVGPPPKTKRAELLGGNVQAAINPTERNTDRAIFLPLMKKVMQLLSKSIPQPMTSPACIS